MPWDIDQNTLNQPALLCAAIRRSFQDAPYVYKNGSCFEFHTILKTVYSSAVAYTDGGHVWSRIGDDYYDIDGKRPSGGEGLRKMDGQAYVRAHRWTLGTEWRVNKMHKPVDNETGRP